MEIPASFDILNRLAAREAESRTGHGELGRDAFMQLLVNQLANQDPLSPLQDHEFVAQLATFSNLEQLEQLNQSMQTSILLDQSVNNSLATNLIGKEILAGGTALTIGDEGSASFDIELGGAADVVVLIRDADGNLVRRLAQGELPAGNSSLSWDGNTESGDRAEPGEYDVEILATASDGTSVESQMRLRTLVTGIRFVDGIGYLMAGDASIALADVLEVFAAS